MLRTPFPAESEADALGFGVVAGGAVAAPGF